MITGSILGMNRNPIDARKPSVRFIPFALISLVAPLAVDS